MFPDFPEHAFPMLANTSALYSKKNYTWINMRQVVLINEVVKLSFLAMLLLFVAFLCCRECDVHRKMWEWFMEGQQLRAHRDMVVAYTDARHRTNERAAGDIA
ncbi:hypothetical protein CDAR_490081 [Caerostris darwini]|uniref:Uncharacterized protein n=1 Tax=Caerostris darwini TaxID=1538125 RepID=A0AAV4TJH2_9ARAC|nr:hypothetical protein CDAR_490081 [Caerostris darwini]